MRNKHGPKKENVTRQQFVSNLPTFRDAVAREKEVEKSDVQTTTVLEKNKNGLLAAFQRIVGIDTTIRIECPDNTPGHSEWVAADRVVTKVTDKNSGKEIASAVLTDENTLEYSGKISAASAENFSGYYNGSFSEFPDEQTEDWALLGHEMQSDFIASACPDGDEVETKSIHTELGTPVPDGISAGEGVAARIRPRHEKDEVEEIELAA